MSIEEIRGFVALSDKLATAGQPSEEQIKRFPDEGYDVVINLGLMDPRYCLADEHGLVESLGMSYYHIPVEFGAPTTTDLARFFRVMDDNQDKKIFVHCAANYRVSCFVAMYAQAHYGWSDLEALNFIKRVWEPDHVWLQFMNNSAATAKVAVSDA